MASVVSVESPKTAILQDGRIHAIQVVKIFTVWIVVTLLACGSAMAADPGPVVARSARDSTPAWPKRAQWLDEAPNVLVILLDDVGFGDLQPYGSAIETPTIDRLAREGVRFNHFTATGVCSPSRAALLTGRNHHAVGVGWASDLDFGYPGYRGEIRGDVRTLPEILRSHGYATLMVGKWHLVNAAHRSPVGPFDAWPTGRGFGRFFGFLPSHTSQWVPHELYEGTTRVEPAVDGSFYFPDVMTDRAIELLREHRALDGERPFFLYYSTGAAHSPHHTRAADRRKYAGRFDDGWDEVRAQRLARQKASGLVPDTAQLAPYYPGVRPWAEHTAEERRLLARYQENYAAFLDNLDQNLARLIAHLESTGELDDTLILLASDNGASRESSAIGTSNQNRYFSGMPESLEVNLRDVDGLGGMDSYPNYPLGWMQASNTPFKYAKASVHGGGVRVPMIVRWPKGFDDQGAVRSQFHHITDIAPTVLEAVGLPPEPGMQGVSMLETLRRADAPQRHTEQYYEMEGNRAFYADGWKLVAYHPDGERFESYPWELYHLESDFSESRDLAAEQPERVRELEQRFWAAAERDSVLPLDDRWLGERRPRPAARPAPETREISQIAQTIPTSHAPATTGRSYSISVELTRGLGDGGVLLAMGDIHSGYVLYVQDERLHFEQNRAGEFTRLTSNTKLAAGRQSVRFDYERDARGLAGRARLFVGDASVGELRIESGPPLVIWEGLDVGRDRGSPVTHRYSPPFAFTGEIHRVVYDLR